ncbi:efflux RND transporter periplasmic adaptor subunit [bacterium]|nr:efflux RND transporter periplasmic adaptor subunit [bacterium]
MKKKKRILFFRLFVSIISISIISVLALRYWQVYKRKTTQKAVQQVPPVPVEVLEIQKQSKDIIDSFRGVLKPIRESAVSARVGGTIKKVFFMEGDHVKKDDTLLIIDDELLRIDVDEAAARYQKAVLVHKDALRNLSRQQKLAKDNIVSEEELADAELKAQIANNEMNSFEADMARKKKKLEYATVKAPFDGIISQLSVDDGETVFPATPLLSILDILKLKIQFFVTDIEIPAFKIGLPLSFTVDAYPNENFISKIVSIDPGADEVYLNFKITSLYNNYANEKKLLPGMVVRIQAKLGEIKDSFFVPIDIVFQTEEGAFVFIVKDNKAEMVYVSLDRQLKDEIVITSGLQPADQVVITGYSSLQNGSEVKIINKFDAVPENKVKQE